MRTAPDLPSPTVSAPAYGDSRKGPSPEKDQSSQQKNVDVQAPPVNRRHFPGRRAALRLRPVLSVAHFASSAGSTLNRKQRDIARIPAGNRSPGRPALGSPLREPCLQVRRERLAIAGEFAVGRDDRERLRGESRSAEH